MKSLKFIIVLLVLSQFQVPVSKAAELKIIPSVAVIEEYNDNVLLKKDKTDDYITRLLPSVLLRSETARTSLDIDYTLDYRYYAKHGYSFYRDQMGTDKNETGNYLNSKAHLDLVRNFFQVDATDLYERASLDITRDYTRESLFVKQSDRNIFTLDPYFTIRLRPCLTLKLGYTYIDTWYREEAATDSTDQIGYAGLSYAVSPHMEVGAGYKYLREHNDLSVFTRQDGYLNATYEYADNSLLFARAGESRVDFDENGASSVLFWNFKLSHNFSPISVGLETYRDFVTSPEGVLTRQDYYGISQEWTQERTAQSLIISVTEYRNAGSKLLQNRSYRAEATFSFEPTTRVKTAVDLAAERWERKIASSTSKRFLGGVRLDYRISEKAAAAFIYRYTDSSSPDIETDNYNNNRIFIQITKQF